MRIASIGIAGVLAACAPTEGPDDGDLDVVEPPHNFLVLVLDDMGVDKVAAYQAHPLPPDTHTLDRLAEEGVLFRRFYTNQLCSPSRGSLITGVHGYGNGVPTHLWGNDEKHLSEGVPTIPEALTDYASAAIGKWHLGGRRDQVPQPSEAMVHGFGSYSGQPDNYAWGDGQWESYFHYMNLEQGGAAGNGTWAPRDGYATTDEVDAAIDQANGLPEPWFVWVGMHAPHVPNHVPPPALNPRGATDASTEIEKYDAMMGAADMEIGRLLDSIDPDVLERTTVFVLGDNGTPQMAVEPVSPWAPGKNTPYESGIHTPLIVWGRGVVEGEEVTSLVSHTDLFATLVDLAGSDAPIPPDSVSFAPLLQNPWGPPTRALTYSELLDVAGDPPVPVRHDRIVVGPRYKLIHLLDREEFYDLEADPGESIDLFQQGPLPPALEAELDVLYAELDRQDALAGR